MKSFSNAVPRVAIVLLMLLASSGLQASTGKEPGKWRIVNYWSEWCAPCREEIPMLNELNDQLELSGVDATIVGVNFEDSPRSETLEIAQRMGIRFPTLTRDEVGQLQLTAPHVLPTTYILGPDDRLVASLAGAQDRAGLLDQLEQLDLLRPEDSKVAPLPNPAGGNSSLSRVVADSQGIVHLSWVSQQGEVSTLSFARFERGLWQAPEVIASGDDWFLNWADFPSLVVNDNSMAAHWLRKSAAGAYDYDVRASFYPSESRQWSEPVTIHKDGVSAEHGFVSLRPMSEGRTFISWLDGRNTRAGAVESEAADGHEDHSMGGAMTLRAGIFGQDGQTQQEWELDGRVCDCCQTSAALAASGPVVVYRDRSDEEIRDTYITRLVGGQWSKPKAVFHDGWEIAGCPVNGPSVTAQGDLVAVAWFTAADDSPTVKLALSNDSGASFSAPLIVSRQNTLGRIGSDSLTSGDIVVSWVEAEGQSANVMLARYSPEGELQERVQVARTLASRRSGFPVIASVENDVYVTWTDVSGEPEVRLARVRFEP